MDKKRPENSTLTSLIYSDRKKYKKIQEYTFTFTIFVAHEFRDYTSNPTVEASQIFVDGLGKITQG